MIISINVSNKLRLYEHYVIKWKYLNTSVESPWSGY